MRTIFSFAIAVALVCATATTSSAIGLSDPFGGAGNRSLAINNFGGGTTTPSNQWPFVTWDFGDVAEATIEFDLYMQDDPAQFWTYVDFRVGDTDGNIPNTGENTITWDNFRIQGSSGAFYFENAVGPASGHPFSINTAHHVQYDIDHAAGTYTVQVDGNFVQKAAGNDNNPNRSPWAFGSRQTFDTVAFGGAFGFNEAPYYLDNILIKSGGNTLIDENFDDDPVGGLPDSTALNFGASTSGSTIEIVPEPTSAALALLATITLWFGRRKR